VNDWSNVRLRAEIEQQRPGPLTAFESQGGTPEVLRFPGIGDQFEVEAASRRDRQARASTLLTDFSGPFRDQVFVIVDACVVTSVPPQDLTFDPAAGPYAAVPKYALGVP
jgi:hypothetical protein